MKRLSILTARIDEEAEVSDLYVNILGLEKEEADEAKFRLIQLAEDTRVLKEATGQRREAWIRLEAELAGLRALNAEHGFRLRLSQARGHIDLERLRGALDVIKVKDSLLFQKRNTSIKRIEKSCLFFIFNSLFVKSA